MYELKVFDGYSNYVRARNHSYDLLAKIAYELPPGYIWSIE